MGESVEEMRDSAPFLHALWYTPIRGQSNGHRGEILEEVGAAVGKAGHTLTERNRIAGLWERRFFHISHKLWFCHAALTIWMTIEIPARCSKSSLLCC